MSADFSKVMAHLAEQLKAHAGRDGLTGVQRAVFLDRGGHAPGEVCPTEPPADPHIYWCEWPDDECSCPPGPAHEANQIEVAEPGGELIGYRTRDGKLWHPADVEIVRVGEPAVRTPLVYAPHGCCGPDKDTDNCGCDCHPGPTGTPKEPTP